MNRAMMIAFGFITLIVGVGIGYFMYTHPEGLNPAWPLWMALFAPALFVLGGLHVIAEGLGRPSLSGAMLRAILFCFGAIINWAAFFTTHIQCLATISFLGAAVAGWHPSEMECRNSLRVLVAIIDAVVLIAFGAFVWQRHRTPREGRLN